MIKQALAQGDVHYLNKIFDAYMTVRDEKEIIKVASKLILLADKVNNKDRLVLVFDTIYEIVNKQRKILREVLELEETELSKGEKRKVRYLRDYKTYLSSTISEMLKKLLKDLKKGVTNAAINSKEIELFLMLNFADYSRYLCEVTFSQNLKEEFISDTEEAYNKFFSTAQDSKITIINPSYLTACYNYALFQYEILNKKEEATQYLKDTHNKATESLDTIYKLYVDSYDLISLISDTSTRWSLNLKAYKEGEAEKEKESVVLKVQIN